MKNPFIPLQYLILFTLLFYIPIQLLAQKKNISFEKLNKIFGFDSIEYKPVIHHFDNGNISVLGKEKHFYDQNGQAGLYLPVGFWKSFHENGKLKLEYCFTKKGIRYLNMWLPNGTQILKNGVGFLYEIQYGIPRDSIVYTVEDSLYNGIQRRFRKRLLGHYDLVGKVNYKNGLKHGLSNFHDSLLNIRTIEYYKKGNYLAA